MNRIRRHGLSVILVLAGLAVALAGWKLADQTSQTTQLCHVTQTLSHIESEFLRTDALDRAGALTATEREQTIQAFGKIFAHALLTKLINKQHALDQRTINYWRYDLSPQAEALSHSIGCHA